MTTIKVWIEREGKPRVSLGRTFKELPMPNEQMTIGDLLLADLP